MDSSDSQVEQPGDYDIRTIYTCILTNYNKNTIYRCTLTFVSDNKTWVPGYTSRAEYSVVKRLIFE